MESFIEAVQKGIADRNWYAALAVALILPDICGKIQYPEQASTTRYANWFDSFVKDKYTCAIGPYHEIHVFLNGVNCYALRCSYLHEGSADISQQKAHTILSEFKFVAPRENWSVHLNQFNNQLQLQVDLFCQDICDGVRNWVHQIVDKNPEVQERMRQFITIYSIFGDPISIP